MVHPSDQMSEAVEAPSSWMTSGATEHTVDSDQRPSQGSGVLTSGLTPVGRSRYIVLLVHRVEIERHAKVGKLDVAVFGGQDIGGFEIAVDDLGNAP